MDRLLELLARYGLTDDALANLAALAALRPDQLTSLEGELVALAEDRSLTLAELRGIADALDVVRGQDDAATELRSSLTNPVTAGGAPDAGDPPIRRPSLRRAAMATSGGRHAPRLPQRAATVRLTDTGRWVADVDQLAEAIIERQRSFRGPHRGEPVYHRVAQLRAEYPEDRRLGDDAGANTARLTAAFRQLAALPAGPAGLQALTAAGGLCAPVSPLYDQQVLASSDRPGRDALPSFEATRGGVTFVPPPAFPGSFGDGVTVWTAANDENPGSDGPATKPCATLTCEDPTTVNVEAITRCLEVGNFLDRTFPERVEAALETLAAVHAQTAERQIIDAIDAGSTAVTGVDVGLGLARNVLYNVALAATGYRDRNRMPTEAPLDVWLPRWVLEALRVDRTLELPGSPIDGFGWSRAQVDGWFTVRALRPVWFLDRQAIGAQAAGALVNWPTTAELYLHAPGTFLFLDGGVLDLGVVRDSGLVSTNDLRVFAETFEAVVDMGHESMALTVSTCVTGETAGTVDVACQGS